MKKLLKYPVFIIVILVIVAIFMMVLRRYQSAEMLCVNLTLVVVNSTLLFCRVFNTSRRDQVNRTLTEAQVAGRRVRWISSLLYSIFSLITVARSLLHHWSFKEVVGFQVILLIGLVLCYIVSLGVTRSAQKRIDAHEAALETISALQKKIKAIESRLLGNELCECLDIATCINTRIDNFKVAKTKTAQQIDRQIGEKLDLIDDLLDSIPTPMLKLKAELEAVKNLTYLRT
ncbi:MAG: hypothetical protein SNH13_04535 [Rikenellaceae bacterium]